VRVVETHHTICLHTYVDNRDRVQTAAFISRDLKLFDQSITILRALKTSQMDCEGYFAVSYSGRQRMAPLRRSYVWGDISVYLSGVAVTACSHVAAGFCTRFYGHKRFLLNASLVLATYSLL